MSFACSCVVLLFRAYTNYDRSRHVYRRSIRGRIGPVCGGKQRKLCVRFHVIQAKSMPVISLTIPRSKTNNAHTHTQTHVRPGPKAKGCHDHSTPGPHRLVLQSPMVSCLKRPYNFWQGKALRWPLQSERQQKPRRGGVSQRGGSIRDTGASRSPVYKKACLA